jgi:mono/diheme cytochrome c family protein
MWILLPARLRRLAVAGGALAALTVLGGCQVKSGQADLVNGKQLFVQRCGSCHVLGRAETRGNAGPNLDEAFQAALGDGLGRGTVRGVVHEQILYPSIGSQMPAKLVTGQDAEDVAAYVARVAARPGEDSGALATAVGGEQKALAVARAGKLTIPADPNGQLLYTFKDAQSEPGQLQIDSPNESPTPHNIALEGGGVNELGPVIQNGAVSSIDVTVNAGEYTFYCSVQGHREGGMEGTLTVR